MIRRHNTKPSHMLKTVWIALLTCLVLGSTGSALFLKDALREKQATLEAMIARNIEAGTHIAELEHQVTELEGRITELAEYNANLNHRLEATFAPTEVRGMADFPVLRGMARQGDTVESFARREGTTADIILTLNPWLRGRRQVMADYQTVWIPKAPRS